MKLRITGNQMEDVEGLHNEYPYAFHLADLEKTHIPWHWHEALEFNYVVTGRVRVSTPGRTVEFSQGEGFFTNSNILAAMENLGSCVLESHLFHPVFLSGHFKSVFETKYMNPVIQNRGIDLVSIPGVTPNQRQLLAMLRKLAAVQQQPDAEFRVRNLLSDIWLLLLEELKTIDPATPKDQGRIYSMLSFIHSHYSEKLTLEEIAGAASISTRECLRCFRNSIGQSPMEYLIDYRINESKKMLENTELPITEVALRTGFNSAAYFSKLFHRTCGKTPNSFRKEVAALRKGILSPAAEHNR